MSPPPSAAWGRSNGAFSDIREGATDRRRSRTTALPTVSVGGRPPPGAWLNADSDLPHAARKGGDMQNSATSKLAPGVPVPDSITAKMSFNRTAGHLPANSAIPNPESDPNVDYAPLAR